MANRNLASAGRTGHLDMTIRLAFHDAFRRDLGHLASAEYGPDWNLGSPPREAQPAGLRPDLRGVR